jgi:hypothetical protein
MLKISESLFDVPIAKSSDPEEVRKLKDFILHDFRAKKAAVKVQETVASEAAASTTAKAGTLVE